tara:strand:+ start:824 stop:1852 length:1029 start_codon:yes stop_codon:yes gene_type:complete
MAGITRSRTAASGGGQLPTIAFFGSQTWTPSYDVTAKVFVIGAGGGGAAKYDMNGKCSGGGAGGCAVSELTFVSGTAYTITIGAGGTGEPATNAAYSSDAAGNGDDGGNSSLSGSGISTMTANGGSGGVHVNSASDACLGGAGGSASGGTLGNFTGGAGGLLTGIGDHSGSGGGAVGLWTTGNAAPVGTTDGHVGKMGGSINWDHDTFTAAYSLNAGHPTNTGFFNSPVPSLPAFADLVTLEREYQGTYYDNSVSTHSGLTQTRPSGYVISYRNQYYSSKYYGGIAGPFCGGLGWGNVTSAAYAGKGCLGGGGGAASASSAVSCYGGTGGSGGVLIFPSSIG